MALVVVIVCLVYRIVVNVDVFAIDVCDVVVLMGVSREVVEAGVINNVVKFVSLGVADVIVRKIDAVLRILSHMHVGP